MSSASSTVSDPPPSYSSQANNANAASDPASRDSDRKSVKSISPTVTTTGESRSSRHKRHSTASSKHVIDIKVDTSDQGRKAPHKRHSTHSSSSRKEDNKADAAEHTHEQVRRSTYGPEFLKQLAEKGLSDDTTDATGGGKFKLVTGSEAMSILENYVEEKKERASSRDENKHNHADTVKTPQQQPIVFAFTASDGARKVVDYYMTWKGKTGTRQLKGPERKSGFLDEEFNRVTETLDKEYKRLSVLSMEPPNLLPQQTSQLPPVTPQALEVVNELPTVESASPAKHIPPPINPPKPSDTVEPARLSASSVVSLPLLNMIRGVPLGNRLPLYVTNPDPASSTTSSVRGSIVDAGGQGKDLSEAVTEALTRPKTPVSRSPSEPSSEDSSKTEKSEKSSRKHRASPTNKSPTAPKDDKSSEILIVLVDEKSDHTWHGLERKLTRKSTKSSTRTASGERYSPWLGPLVAANKVTYRRPSRRGIRPLRRHSMQTDDSSSLSPSSSDEDDFEGDDNWKGPAYPSFPVVPAYPIKSYLINEGLLPPEQSGEKPVTLRPLDRSLSNGSRSMASSVYSYHSPYVTPVDMPGLVGSATSLNGYPRGPPSTASYAPSYASYVPAVQPSIVSMPMSPPVQTGQMPGFAHTGSPVQVPGYMSMPNSPYARAGSVYDYLPGGFVPYH
ncbi:hypothetical protein PC9H_003003 [Pleurotus ostreatus]|uniref:Uncharacterized protein n=2 Tax=Pleurotus ostreatus TaxID=5322 RepID=A0A8H7DUW6_PLEOS|nr:uncharacterized protein PC9H_003003 [Pleurotus ostreatus]KAF7436177.1 hypothetical protein PC9H_003003 [Pleurotus ostreatus]